MQTHRGAWLWLFDKAAWRDTTDRFGRFAVQLRRGEIACSLRFLARAWNWTHGRVQRWLNLLAARGKITMRTDGGVIVISLCGYRESTRESQKVKRAAVETPVDDQQPSRSEKQETQKVDINSKSVPVRRFAARTAATTKQIRERWIAKLGRFAAARGIAGFWLRCMSDDKAEVDRFLEDVNARMRRERWNDVIDEGALVNQREQRRRRSFVHAARRPAQSPV